MSKRIFFVVAAVVLLGTGLFLQSRQSKEAKAQADNIVKLDATGGSVTTELDHLKAYVRSHSGANVSFTLTEAYGRAQAAAKAAAAASAANSQIYADAQRACAGKSDSVTQARCNSDYLASHLVNVPNPAPVAEPKLADYQYTLRSPFLAPDIAGALFMGSAVAFILAAADIIRARRRR